MKYLLVAFLAISGIMHFIKPKFFKAIIPDYFPSTWRLPLVYWSGFFEILGAIGLVSPYQNEAAWGLILLLVAVFPANVFMAYNSRFSHIPAWIRWGRLPLQLPLLYWVYQYTL